VPGGDAEHLIGGGDVPAGVWRGVDTIAKRGLEVAGQVRRRGDEGEASTHEACIVPRTALAQGYLS
jgi:hypothetical protein